MSLKGDLRTVGLTTLLQILESDSKTGLLQIKNKDKVVGLFLKDGGIAYATCSQSDSKLGYLLRSSGVITEEELEVHLALSEDTNQALGKILVDKNVITSGKLSEFIQEQAENIIYDLFFWEGGVYEYLDVEIDSERLLLKKINIMHVLLEASRRIDEMQVIKQLIPDNSLVFEKSGDIKSVVDKLNEQELSILALVDGKCSVRQVIEKSGLDEYSVLNILNSLILSGCIHPYEGSTPQESVVVEVAQHENPNPEKLQLESDGDSEEIEETIPEKTYPFGDTEDDVSSENVEAEEHQESVKVVADAGKSIPVKFGKELQYTFLERVINHYRGEGRFIVIGVTIICLLIIIYGSMFALKYIKAKRMETAYQSVLMQVENTSKLEEREKVLLNFLKSNKENIHSRDAKKKIKEIRGHIIDKNFNLTVSRADELSQNKNNAEARDVYHQYLDQYPKTVYTDEIQKKLAKVNSLVDAEDYGKLKDIAPRDYETRITEYDRYLKNHPEGKYKEKVVSLSSSAIKGYCNFLKDETKAGKNISINTLILEKHKKQILSMSTDLMFPDEKLQVKKLLMKGNQELKNSHYKEATKLYRQSLAVVRDSQLEDFPAYKYYESEILSALNDENLKCYNDGLVKFKEKWYSLQEYEKIVQEHGYVKDKGAWYAPDEYETLMISRNFYKYEDEYLNQGRFKNEVIVPVLRNKCKLEGWQKIDSIDVRLKGFNDDKIVYEILGVAIGNLEDYRVVVKMSVDAVFNKKNDRWIFFNSKKDSYLEPYE